MPKHPRRSMAPGWQAVNRDGAWWLQRLRDDGTWEDHAGPYRQHGSAWDRWWRLYYREIQDARAAGIEHPWDKAHRPP